MGLETEVADPTSPDEDLRSTTDRLSEQGDPATGAAVATRVKVRQ
jgi:hypothetical protein